MSRVIKFRAWDKYERSMIPVRQLSFNEYVSVEDHFADDDKVFMQYTGLKDKNGTEIFEGDILKDDYFEIYGEVYFSANYASFQCDVMRFGGDEPCCVVGNIYENPELMLINFNVRNGGIKNV